MHMTVPEQAGESLRPELESQRAIRFELMSDQAIEALNRLVAERPDLEPELGWGSDYSEGIEAIDAILEACAEPFARDFPERSVPLFRRMMASVDQYDLQLGMLLAPGVAIHEPELALDAVLRIAHRHRTIETEIAHDMGVGALNRIREATPPDRQAWLEAKVALYDGEGPRRDD